MRELSKTQKDDVNRESEIQTHFRSSSTGPQIWLFHVPFLNNKFKLQHTILFYIHYRILQQECDFSAFLSPTLISPVISILNSIRNSSQKLRKIKPKLSTLKVYLILPQNTSSVKSSLFETHYTIFVFCFVPNVDFYKLPNCLLKVKNHLFHA